MQQSGPSPWEYSRQRYEELNRFKQTEKKKTDRMETVLGLSTFVIWFPLWCVFYLILGKTNLASVLGLGLGILCAWLIGKTGETAIEKKHTECIANEEHRIERAIAEYQANYDRRQEEAAKRLETERKRKEAAEAVAQREREERERIRVEQQHKALIERLKSEELEADKHMSQSALVSEIAQCILPTFKQIVENVDTEAHMKVRVRLALEVRADTIDYYDAAAPQNRSRFVFAEEGIAEKLKPILRKALCKALATELRLLILEAFPIDPERKMVQADLEDSVVLKSNITYVPGRDYTAPEYDENSYAYAVILYQASKDKEPRRF